MTVIPAGLVPAKAGIHDGSRSGRTWRRSRASPKLEVRRAVRLPHHYPPVGVRVGGALAVEEQDTGLPANAKRPARPRCPGLAGHDARICREAHGLVCRLVVDGNEEVDAP